MQAWAEEEVWGAEEEWAVLQQAQEESVNAQNAITKNPKSEASHV